MPLARRNSPDTYARAIDDYFLATVDAYWAGYGPLRGDWGAVTAVDEDIGRCTVTVAGQSLEGVRYNLKSPPVVGNTYLVKRHLAHRRVPGERWILNIRPISEAQLHYIFVRKAHAWPSPTWPIKELHTFEGNLGIQYNFSNDNYLWQMAGGAFTTITRNGVNINGASSRPYHGPSATAITSAHFSALPRLCYVADNLGNVYANDGLHVGDPGELDTDDTSPWTTSNDFQSRGNAGFEVYALACHLTDWERLWAMGPAGQVAESTDGGRTWAARTSITFMGTEALAFCSPSATTLIATSTSEPVVTEGGGITNIGPELARKRQHISLDGGATWATVTDLVGSHDPILDLPPPAAQPPVTLEVQPVNTFHNTYNASGNTSNWALDYDSWHSSDGTRPAVTTDTASAALESAIDPAATDLTLFGVMTAGGGAFDNGALIRLDSEIIQLAGMVSLGGGRRSYTGVTRGAGGSTPAAHPARTIAFPNGGTHKWWYLRYQLGAANANEKFYDFRVHPELAVRDEWHFT